ncbi:F-box protein At5g67140 [Linum perenne]
MSFRCLDDKLHTLMALRCDDVAKPLTLATRLKKLAKKSFEFVAALQCSRGLSTVLQHISKANSLQHLNIGGTFITDHSLFAIADSCPNLQSIVLWSCRHVTEVGLVSLVHKCQKLKVIDVWGTRVPVDCFIALLTISPALQIKAAAAVAPPTSAPLLPVA